MKGFTSEVHASMQNLLNRRDILGNVMPVVPLTFSIERVYIFTSHCVIVSGYSRGRDATTRARLVDLPAWAEKGLKLRSDGFVD